MKGGIACALASALLFGASAPLAKLLLGHVDPWLLAGLLYLGSGIGLLLLRPLLPRQGGALARADWPWLAAAVLAGGIAGPVLIGASGMAWTRFAAFNALGAVLWAVLLTGLGWFFGQAAQALLGKAQHYEGWLALGVIVVALGYALWSRRRARRGAGPGQGR